MDIYFYREEYKKGKNILYRDFGHFYTKTLALKLWGGATFTLPRRHQKVTATATSS